VEDEGRQLHDELAARVEAARHAAEERSEESRLLVTLVQRLREVARGQELLIRCAWCGRVKAGDDWFDVTAHGHLTPGTVDRCSHGICPDCFSELMPSS
jgi:hypothetical protein